MMSSNGAWMKGKLEDLVVFQRGFDITKAQQEPGNVPIVSSSGTKSYHSVAKVDGPGVVIGRKGTLGTTFYLDEPYWPHDTTLWAKDFKGNNPRFVYYFLKSLRLERFDTGSSNPTLNRNHIHGMGIIYPEVSIQNRIADVLTNYDELIETNLHRIQLLEQASMLIFDEWFVKLQFPGHESTVVTDGIPEGWGEKHLTEIFDTQSGFTESATKEQIGPKFLRGTDINKASYIDWSNVPYCPDDNLDLQKYRLRIGDILVIRMADPGKVAIVESDVQAVFASYLIRLTRKPQINIPTLFLFYTLSGNQYQGFIRGASGGATRKSVGSKLMLEFTILIPPNSLLDTFISHVQPIREQIQTLLAANAEMRQARDSLNSHLVNGDVAL